MNEPPRRVNYVAGRLLTAADLEADQAYHRRMRYLTNRLHGYGVATGLDVTLAGGQVEVGPGVAIDPLGRELVLTEPARVPLGPARGGRAGRVLVLVLLWGEDEETPVPVPGEATAASWVVERPRLLLLPLDEQPGEAVTLARLHGGRRDITLDVSVRRRWGRCEHD